MNENKKKQDIPTLIAHIKKHTELLEESINEIIAAENVDIPKLGKTNRAGVLLAGLLENYYTCTETVFVRISQFFENHLSAEKWHKELLEKMTLEIDGLRPRLLSDEVYADLLEIMRFRHFKRYYFGTSYDWIRLDELLNRIKRTHNPLREQIKTFLSFLEKLDKN